MVTLITAKGKELKADKVSTLVSPPRMYINLLNKTLVEAAIIFTDPKELPLEGYPEFTELQSLSISTNGVNISLKKENT